MSNKSKNRDGIIYSTNPDFEYKHLKDEIKTFPPPQQQLEIWKQKRSGKTVIIIKGFIGSNQKLKQLSKLLKVKCAVGGSVKSGDIIIQGDVRENVQKILSELNYKSKRIGG
ncbi:MAG: translation initiation factor [Bacteroidota bacterium]|nr:translation initiation factor [Bacteroidota bacterium]